MEVNVQPVSAQTINGMPLIDALKNAPEIGSQVERHKKQWSVGAWAFVAVRESVDVCMSPWDRASHAFCSTG